MGHMPQDSQCKGKQKALRAASAGYFRLAVFFYDGEAMRDVTCYLAMKSLKAFKLVH